MKGGGSLPGDLPAKPAPAMFLEVPGRVAAALSHGPKILPE